MAAPAGAPASSEKVNVALPQVKASVAVVVKVSGASSFTVLSPIPPRTGAWFAPRLTVIGTTSKSLRGGAPLSVTRTVTGKVPPVDGVQLKAPVEAPMVAPGGAPASREKVRLFAGMSASVAVAVNVKGA